MKDNTTQSVKIEELKAPQAPIEEEKPFLKRFTCENVIKILYLVFSVSFGHGIFALIIYFIANKKYGLILTIGAVISGFLHFLYECYKILYNEEILMKELILKNQLKNTLIASKRVNYNIRYRLLQNK